MSGDDIHLVQKNAVLTSLDVAHTGARDAQSVGELCLTEFSLVASLLEARTKPGLNPLARGAESAVSLAGHIGQYLAHSPSCQIPRTRVRVSAQII